MCGGSKSQTPKIFGSGCNWPILASRPLGSQIIATGTDSGVMVTHAVCVVGFLNTELFLSPRCGRTGRDDGFLPPVLIRVIVH